MPYSLHALPIGDQPVLDGILQIEDAGLESGFVPDVVVALLAKAEVGAAAQ